MSDPDKDVFVYRYLRGVVFDPDIMDYHISPRGGIVFYFLLPKDSDQLLFSFSVCGDTESFCFQSAKTKVKNYFDNGNYTLIPYDRGIPLIDNVLFSLHKMKEEINFNVWKNSFKDLYIKMKELQLSRSILSDLSDQKRSQALDFTNVLFPIYPQDIILP